MTKQVNFQAGNRIIRIEADDEGGLVICSTPESGAGQQRCIGFAPADVDTLLLAIEAVAGHSSETTTGEEQHHQHDEHDDQDQRQAHGPTVSVDE